MVMKQQQEPNLIPIAFPFRANIKVWIVKDLQVWVFAREAGKTGRVGPANFPMAR